MPHSPLALSSQLPISTVSQARYAAGSDAEMCEVWMKQSMIGP